MACSSKGANDRRINQYEKIITLDEITSQLLQLTSKKIDVNQFGTIPVGDFMTTVDLEQPHMWLEGHMHIAETRFAYAINELLKSGITIHQLKEVVYEAGKQISNNTDDLELAYSYFTFNYLDGMPCDTTVDAYMIDHTIKVEIVEDSHLPFWNKVNGDINIYYMLLEEYARGMLPNIQFKVFNNKFYTFTKK